MVGTSFLNFTYSPKSGNSEEVVVSSIDLNKLCKAWYIVSGKVKEADKTEEFPEDMINTQFIFNLDFTFELKGVDGKSTKKGTWKELKESKIYVTVDEDPITFEITTLTDTKLVLTTNYKKSIVDFVFSSTSDE